MNVSILFAAQSLIIKAHPPTANGYSGVHQVYTFDSEEGCIIMVFQWQ